MVHKFILCSMCLNCKKAVSPTLPVSHTLPDPAQERFRIPVKVLQHRLRNVGNTLTSQLLIQWSWPASMPTWENEVEIKNKFPLAPAWGQAGSQGGEDVTTPQEVQVPGLASSTQPTRIPKPNKKYLGSNWVAA